MHDVSLEEVFLKAAQLDSPIVEEIICEKK
jgi:hypothetical protein